MTRLARVMADGLATVRGIASTGLLRPVRPDQLLGMGLALGRFGPTLAAGYAAAAARHPKRLAVIDDAGSMTYAELARDADRLARGLSSVGLHSGDQAGVLIRNSRYLPLTLAALAELGVDALLLNTGFSAAQAAEVLRRHDAAAVIADAEFAAVAAEAGRGRLRVVAWPDRAEGTDELSIDALVRRGATARRSPRATREARLVILTSGTTGTPKGAARGGSSTAVATTLLDGLPVRAGGTTVLAAPAFHAWGLAHLALAVVLGNTLVLRRRFEATQVLADLSDHRADTLAVVPVMLQRLLEINEGERRRYDTSALRVVAASGSALAGDLGTRFLDGFGDVLYNLYGSTEIGYVTVAGPEDLRAAPGTAGRVLRGVDVRLLDADDCDVADGEIGRIFVGSPLVFEGYTGGGDKPRVDGYASTGDLGRFDSDGRLFVTGRDDDMIVSGGENVYPAEVEDLLASQPGVAEAAVVGAPDPEFGQRLVAFVVAAEGVRLDADELRATVKRQLAGYKVPREIRFCAALPRNATGKVLKRELQEQC